MNTIERRPAALVAAMLLITVVTQIFYVTMLSGESAFAERWADIARPSLWMIELAAFTVISVAAMVAAARGALVPSAWAALALFGLFNIVQLAMGLSMFGILQDAGEAAAPVFSAVLAGAFFFYILGKALLGLAAIGFGFLLIKASDTLPKLIGGLAALLGIAAAAINIFALPQGMTHVQLAGASGTLAALLAAIALLMLPKQTAN